VSHCISCLVSNAAKIWDLSGTSASSYIPTKPTYTLHPAYPVRRVLWRPDYPCELALVSNAEVGAGSGSELMVSPRLQNITTPFIAATCGVDTKDRPNKSGVVADAVEIWDVRRGWIAKWTVEASILEGGVTGMFAPLLFMFSRASVAQMPYFVIHIQSGRNTPRERLRRSISGRPCALSMPFQGLRCLGTLGRPRTGH